MVSNMLRFCGCDQGSPTESISARKSKPHKTSNGTSQRHPAAEIHCAHFSNLLHARAVGTKFNLRIALCLQQQRPWQKGRSCSSKGRRLEQQALQYLRVPPRLFDSFALNTHTKSGRYEQVRRKMNNRTGWNGSKTGKTSSKNTAREIKENIHRMHLCLQQQGPQWVQRHQSLPSLSPADGQVLLFQKQAGGKHKITHNDQRHVSINVDQQE